MANHLAGQGPVIQMQRKAILGRISDIVDWLAYKWGKLKNIKLEGSEEEIKDSEEERDTILEKMYRILGNGKWDFAINDEWMQTGQIRGGQGSNYYNLFKEIDTLLDEQGKQALNELLGRYDSNDERLKVLFTNNRAHKLGKQYAKVVEKKLSEEEVEQISEKMDEIYKDDQMNEIGIDKGGMFKILLQTNQNSIDEVIGVINKYSAEKTKEETVVSSDEYEEYKKFINSTYKDSLFEEGKNAFIYYVIKEQWQNTNFFNKTYTTQKPLDIFRETVSNEQNNSQDYDIIRKKYGVPTILTHEIQLLINSGYYFIKHKKGMLAVKDKKAAEAYLANKALKKSITDLITP